MRKKAEGILFEVTLGSEDRKLSSEVGGLRILFGSVASGIATKNSDIDSKIFEDFIALPFALFSPYKVLNANERIVSEVKAVLERVQEKTLLPYAAGYPKGFSLARILVDYIHWVSNGIAFDERCVTKNLDENEMEASLIADMLPAFIDTLERFKERGMLESPGPGRYKITQEGRGELKKLYEESRKKVRFLPDL